MIHPLVEQQFASLANSYPGAKLENPDGTPLVVVPEVLLLPEGLWSQPKTQIIFAVPQGFPHARPDCFWTEGSVRLASGAMPQNTGFQGVPGMPGQFLWFSWHLSDWNPNRHNLLTYLGVIQQRLRDPR